MSQLAARPVEESRERATPEAASNRFVGREVAYERSTLSCGIAMLGHGPLHLSQLTLLMDRYLQRRPGNWMIHGVACGPEDISLCGAINVNDGVFTLLDGSGPGASVREIRSIKRMTHAPSRPEQVERLLVSEDIHVIAVTLQPGGCPSDALGDLDVNDPAIRNDLRDGSPPSSVIGHLYLAAANRQRMGARGFTVLRCDDVIRNGAAIATLLIQFAELKDPSVAEWIRDNLTFPNSMIDLALPVDSTSQRLSTLDTVRGPCVTNMESEVQWVIEDRFASDRPLLGLVGATFTDHIEPYEAIRSRMLGSAQLAIAYVGALLGYACPARAMDDKSLVRLLERVLDEAAVGLSAPHGADLDAYAAGVIRRLGMAPSGGGMGRLAANGSRKIPATLVPVVRACSDADRPFDAIAFVIAAWCRYLRGVDERGAVIDIDDPLATHLVSRAGVSPKDPAHLLGMTEIFGRSLSMDDRFVRSVGKWLGTIDRLGMANALEHLIDG